MTKVLWQTRVGIRAEDLPELLEKLSEKVPAHEVSFRIGRQARDKTSAILFPYVDARYVQEKLDELCGPYWQVEYKDYPSGQGLICNILIKIDGEWIGREDGAGTGRGELGQDIGIAEKGAISDAFKRAAVAWGIARHLYNWPDVWVKIDGYKILGIPAFPDIYNDEEVKVAVAKFLKDNPSAKPTTGGRSAERQKSEPKKTKTNNKPVDKAVLKRAGEVVVPAELPQAGKKVSELPKPFLLYFAGKRKTDGSADFIAETDDQKALQAAAEYYLIYGGK